MKKILSIFLSLMMVFSLANVAFAEDSEEIEVSYETVTEEIEKDEEEESQSTTDETLIAASELEEDNEKVLASSTASYLTINSESKTITITNDSSVTNEIQDAINYINESESDKSNWTILVETGLYSTYTVPDGVSVTVMAKDSTNLVAVSDDINYTLDQTGIEVDATNKIIYVTDVSDETYEIQNAIDYVVTQSTITGWTITINSGTYSRFVVYDGMDDLTIQAADGVDVKVSVLDGSEMQIIDYTFINNKGTLSYYYYDANNISESNIKNEYRSDHWQQGYYDDDGVIIMDVDTLTISGIEFEIGTTTTGLYPSAISTYQSAADSLCPNNLTIDSCTFTGSGYDITDVTSAAISYGIFVCTAASEASNWTVFNCTFTNIYCGVEIMNDNNYVGKVNITNNYFENCDRAVDGYFGNSREVLNQSKWGEFIFTGNTVIGNSDEYCKILLGDDVSTWTSDDYYKRDYDAFGYVTLSGNTLSYAEFIIFGIEDEQLTNTDLLEANTYTTCAFVLEGSESTYSAEINFVMDFESDEDDTGYWAYLGNTTLSSYYYVGRDWTDAEYAIVIAAIEKANATGSHTLILDFSSLYDESSDTYDNEYSAGNSWEWTVVCLKYGIRWVSTSGEDPNVEKSITSASTVEVGDSIDFSLTLNTPEYLDAYTLDEDTDGVENKLDSYVVTVHDKMDSALMLDNDSIKVTINDVVLDSSYYTITTSELEDGCTFEIKIDLVKLVEDGILTADDEGNYSDIVITYCASVADDTAAGTYENSTWVTYGLDGESEISTVIVTVPELEVKDESTDLDEPTVDDEVESTEENTVILDNTEDIDTSDNTVMYIYAILALCAACGTFYITKKKEEF